MSFNDRLRQAREATGMTQQQVADALGVDKTTYSGYETGKRSPDVARIKKIALVLRTTGDWLLETGFAEKEKSPILEDEREMEDPDIRMIARAGKRMTPEQRENLRKYAQYMFPEAFKNDNT